MPLWVLNILFSYLGLILQFLDKKMFGQFFDGPKFVEGRKGNCPPFPCAATKPLGSQVYRSEMICNS